MKYLQYGNVKERKNAMKKILMMTFAAAMTATVSAAGWNAGQGLANDRATGAKERDVTFFKRGGGNEYGYRQYSTPVGCTVLAWSMPNFESSVYGVRLNFGWGAYHATYGLDTGVFSQSKEFAGISWTVFGNYIEHYATGIQAGLVNVVRGEMSGLQIGLVNFADNLNGVQIGVLNFNAAQVTLPVINIGW
jgi:hypothetical protein